MTFDPQWLTGAKHPPEDQEKWVTLCRQFLDTPATQSDPTALVGCPTEALAALVTILVDRDDGLKLSQLTAIKRIRKAIGKTLHRLRSQGKRWSDESGHAGTIKIAREALPSYMSVPHPSGARFLILTGQHTSGSMAAVYALAHETTGLANFLAIPNVSRTKLSNLVEEIGRMQNVQSSEFLVQAEPALVRIRFREAVEIHRQLGKEFPSDYHAFSDLFRNTSQDDEHPIYARIPDVDPNLIHRGPELFGHTDTRREPHTYRIGPADRPIMEPKWTRETGQRLRNAMDSPVLINDHQRKERVLTELERIVEETFDTDFRHRMANRLLDAAYVLQVQQKTDLSHVAMATANALMDVGQSVLTIPWARQALTDLFDAEAFVAAMNSRDPHSSTPVGDEDGGLIIPGSS